MIFTNLLALRQDTLHRRKGYVLSIIEPSKSLTSFVRDIIPPPFCYFKWEVSDIFDDTEDRAWYTS